MTNCTSETYNGFEQGPIRPPSEASSLLLRITRNCPWNQCTFCPVYKGQKFSLRPYEDIIQDINSVNKYVTGINKLKNSLSRQDLVKRILSDTPDNEADACHAALNWYASGMESVFLQDANSLIMKPEELINVLLYIKECFPWIDRITSYARSQTIAKISDANLKKMADAGLNRIHIGLESGSDKVLSMVKKGATKKIHITAGQKVKNAGIQLSEYVMPGLGGKALSEEHAIETASALNSIDPDFIRIRSLAIPSNIPLYADYISGNFQKCNDYETAREILLFIESLNGITGFIKSDHILNLFQNVEGKLPEQKEYMTGIIKSFLAMSPEKRIRYQIGRRIGVFNGESDMHDHNKLSRVESIIKANNITPENIDSVIDDIIRRFI